MGGEESVDDDPEKLDIPIHAFDLIVADECHRGYTSSEVALWRKTLEHFDAIKIGLTATPAAHTTAYFKDTVYRYEYDRAVREGFLVDYDVVKVRSNVRMNGVFLKEGEEVGLINPETGSKKLDSIEDERAFDASTVEREITSPDSCHAGAVTMHYDQCHLSACHPLSFPDGEVVIEHCKIDFAP